MKTCEILICCFRMNVCSNFSRKLPGTSRYILQMLTLTAESLRLCANACASWAAPENVGSLQVVSVQNMSVKILLSNSDAVSPWFPPSKNFIVTTWSPLMLNHPPIEKGRAPNTTSPNWLYRLGGPPKDQGPALILHAIQVQGQPGCFPNGKRLEGC